MGANQFAPLIPAYQARDHLTQATVMAVFGAYAVGVIPALLFSGPHSDRHGRRSAVRLGVLLSLCSTLVMMAGAASPIGLYAGRFLAGLSAGVALGAGSAWVNELTSSTRAGTGARRATIAESAGFGGGPLASSAAAEWLPAPTVIPYVLHAALMCAVIPLLWNEPEPEPATPSTRSTSRLSVPTAARRFSTCISNPAALEDDPGAAPGPCQWRRWSARSSKSP
ncbi:hypothetical protein SSPO_100240 [Streptomyces antimycoticus]|uniref:Major facilitator superfamily (MFS) profile domain-containing protein n=1 Tax=Streptomyces antimycoticus TaxID=68175 RepID=A0A499VGJ6_9ACTN|nr:hypothetical protein SSPO_100240 [Streptomyces antimycoticus]